jgi:ribosomal protein L14E/L6E/L27E
MTAGTIIKSKAGRDKGSLLMVLAVEDPYVLLADGRGRKLEKPKRKKIKHVALSGFEERLTKDDSRAGVRLITESGRELTNRELRGVLSRCAALEQGG